MEEKEKIKVYIDIQDGKTVCICKRNRRAATRSASPTSSRGTSLKAGRTPSAVTASGNRPERAAREGMLPMRMNVLIYSRDPPDRATGPPGNRFDRKD